MIDLKNVTDEQRNQLRYALERKLWQEDFFEFYKRAVQELEPQTNLSFTPHLEYLCQSAQQIVENCVNGIPNNDVVINVPPRTSKSYVYSICLNAWAWTRYPHLKFMTISYADNLSAKFAYKTRLLIKTNWYQQYFGDVFQLSDDDNRKTSYSNNKSGSRESFGMTGSVTGSGADIIIADDLQKPSEISDTKLDNAINVWRDSIYNRLNNPSRGGCRLQVQQRCHERDITNYMLTNDDSCEHICLPIELTQDVQPKELISLYQDGFLWKERFDEQVLREYKRSPFTYTTQYLQNPLPSTGILIKREWFPVISKQDIDAKEFELLKWEMFLDTAYTANIKNDETACIIAAKYKNNLLIKKVYTWYLEFPQLIRKIKETHQTMMPNNGMIRIEKKANGISLIQTLKNETQLNITGTITPKDSKVIRVTNITSYLESNRCILLSDCGVDTLMQQLTAFPNSSRDGLCDCLYYSIQHLLLTNNTMKYARG